MLTSAHWSEAWKRWNQRFAGAVHRTIRWIDEASSFRIRRIGDATAVMRLEKVNSPRGAAWSLTRGKWSGLLCHPDMWVSLWRESAKTSCTDRQTEEKKKKKHQPLILFLYSDNLRAAVYTSIHVFFIQWFYADTAALKHARNPIEAPSDIRTCCTWRWQRL
jgi:hypothetical protein